MSSMKLTFTLLTMIQFLIASNLHAQELKTFKGEMDKGLCSYQYYEDQNFERVYNGFYNYQSSDGNLHVNGHYTNNKKDGIWSFSFIYGCIHEGINKSYKQGKLNGEYIYVKDVESTRKVLAKSVAHFEDNVQVGEFYFFTEDNSVLGKCSIKAFFLDGLLYGTVTISFTAFYRKPIVYEDKIRFENGFLISRLFRNITDGDVYVNTKRDSLLSNYGKFFVASLNEAIIPYLQTVGRDYSDKDSYELSNNNVKYFGKVEPQDGEYLSNVHLSKRTSQLTLTDNKIYGKYPLVNSFCYGD